MYSVIHMFRDLADNGHIYQPGDNFPRAGIEVSAERLLQLSTCNNLRGKPLIRPSETPVQAAEEKGNEIHAEAVKPAKRAVRSRKKG